MVLQQILESYEDYLRLHEYTSLDSLIVSVRHYSIGILGMCILISEKIFTRNEYPLHFAR